jgi:diguanylate cyclase (GGDEF)-like protein
MGDNGNPIQRDILGGITSPVLLLAYALAIPLLMFMLFLAGDLRRSIPAAQSERLGLTDVRALERLLVDAAPERSAQACGAPADAGAVERDIMAVNALEATGPFAGPEWNATTAAWRAGAPGRRGSAVVENLVSVFRLTADQTKLSYDPEVRGIDMADALTYRLPGTFYAFRRARATLCENHVLSAAARYDLERDSGQLETLIPDLSEDVEEAISLKPPDVEPLRAAETRLEASAATALAAIDRAVSSPSPAAQGEASKATGAAAAATQRLMMELEPSLRAIVEQRLVTLHQRLVLTLLPSIVAVIAGVLVVAAGIRGKIQSAEMAKLRAHQLELRHQATHDGLTSLPNRAAFFQALEEGIDAVWHQGGSLALLFIDLDNFKAINDGFGHAAGDEALRGAALRLTSICSQAAGRITARLGGDEFAMLVTDEDPRALRDRIAGISLRIADELARPLEIEAGSEMAIRISASVGIAFQDGAIGPHRIASEMLREADAAMYESKARGRDRASVFTAPQGLA